MEKKETTWKKQPTLDQLLGILAIIVIPIFIWAVSVEIRFAETKLRLDTSEEHIDEMKTDIKDIKKITNEILIEVKVNHNDKNE